MANEHKVLRQSTSFKTFHAANIKVSKRKGWSEGDSDCHVNEPLNQLLEKISDIDLHHAVF